MKKFNRHDIIELLGDKAHAKINTLNKYNLGEEKTVRIIRENHPAKNQRDVMKTIKFYDTEECIKFFEQKIKQEASNPSARYKKTHIDNWTEIINTVKQLKGLKK